MLQNEYLIDWGSRALIWHRLPPQVTHRSDVSLISIITNACRTAHIAAVIGDACSALSRESISVEMASIGASKPSMAMSTSI